jgi:hypothetical protein
MEEIKTISQIVEEATVVMDWARDLVMNQYEADEERGYVEYEVFIE